MDWKECNIKRLVKKINVDDNLIKSLLNSSQNKLISAKRLKLDKTTCSSIISLCYESLREALEALAIKKGLKIYNHECYTSFLKEIINKEKISIKFDKFRKIRNKINYYGKEISIEETEDVKKEIMILIKQIRELL